MDGMPSGPGGLDTFRECDVWRIFLVPMRYGKYGTVEEEETGDPQQGFE